ncbi:MAG TPA: GNAT family N-acetyltransferase [Anaerolineae bacterium]|nr:GNAT family N-acetyltransferase [Anaerolineae bacterium]HQI87239.1 GNAT family N-acetyltransferase [Anaerolineae bacterium]
MRIIDLPADDADAIQQAATLLVEAFKVHAPNAWPDLDAALEEVREALEPEKVCRAALDVQGEVLGWIGAIPQYETTAWELHPLVVHPAHQGRGIGRALVADLEEQVRARGGLTIYLGTDDEDFRTSLSQVDLYENTWEHIANIRNLNRHPYEFYQKMGYTIVGILPDANGWNKPDIWMAKRVGKK